MLIQERVEPLGIVVAGVPERPADGLADELVLVVEQALRDPVGVVQLAAADEREGRGDRRAPAPRVVGSGELVEHVPGPVDERAPEHLPGAEVDEVPVVDPVVPAEVEGREGLELLVRRGPRLGLLRHDPHRTGADLVRILLEQPLDLVEVHVREVPGGREDRAHPHADELLVALREVAPVLQALGLGRLALEPRDEGFRRVIGRVRRHNRPR